MEKIQNINWYYSWDPIGLWVLCMRISWDRWKINQMK
jgi:hypothetical protein